MISDTITQKIQEAMKAKDDLRLSTLRMLSSALNYEKIAKQHELSKEEELVVVYKEAKKRKDAIEAYEKVLQQSSGSVTGAQERVDNEKVELRILQEYLPPEISENELTSLVDEVIKETGAVGMQDMGKVIDAVKAKAGISADGAKIAEIVKQKLGSGN